MSYRSDVGLAIADYKKLPEKVKDALYGIFCDPEYIDEKKRVCLFFSSGLKWDDCGIDKKNPVTTIAAWMSRHPTSFHLVRIGEEDGDIETRGGWRDPFKLGFTRRLEYEYPDIKDTDRTQVRSRIKRPKETRKGKTRK